MNYFSTIDAYREGLSLLKRIAYEYRFMRMRGWTAADVGLFWDKVCHYDDINKTSYTYLKRFVDADSICRVREGAKVLDISCRTGQGSLYFHRSRKTGHSVAADYSERFLKVCGELLAASHVPHTLLKLDAYRIDLEENRFDAVLSFETVEHVSDPELFISELGRVCKKEGNVIITTPNIVWEPVHWLAAIMNRHHSEGPHRFLRRNRLVRAIQDAGLRIDKELTTILIPGGPAFLKSLSQRLEEKTQSNLARWCCLRRIFSCVKI